MILRILSRVELSEVVVGLIVLTLFTLSSGFSPASLGVLAFIYSLAKSDALDLASGLAGSGLGSDLTSGLGSGKAGSEPESGLVVLV